MGASSVTARILGVAVSAATLVPLGHAADSNIGRAVTSEELAGWDITVFPDGSGLPAGQGTVSDGAHVYQTNCASCHGAMLEGSGIGPALAGGKGTLATDKPLKTVGSYWPYATTLFDYIRRAMPFHAPQSSSDEDVYSVAGYILHVNDLLPAISDVDAAALLEVQMPNRDGFFVIDGPDVKNTRCMQDCAPVRSTH